MIARVMVAAAGLILLMTSASAADNTMVVSGADATAILAGKSVYCWEAGAVINPNTRAVESYDLIFAWDALDRLFAEDRPRLIESLALLTAPGARLHLITRGSDDTLARPLRFTLVDLNRLRYESTAGAPLPKPRLLPAELMKLLAPFHVIHAFTLRSGLREYVARRPVEY